MSSIPTMEAEFWFASNHDSIIDLRSSKVQGLFDSQPFDEEPIATTTSFPAAN